MAPGVAVEIAALTAFLAPFLPRLLKPVQDSVGDAAERLGEKAWEHAQALWGRLQGRVSEKPAAREVAEDVADNPEDPDAQAALAYQLKKLLSEDSELAAQVEALWDRARQDAGVSVQVSASGTRSVAIGRDNPGSIATGDTLPSDR